MDKPDIKDFDDYVAVLDACGCCLPDACPAPIIEAEAITVQACGFNIPAHSKVGAEFRCRIYTSVKSASTVSESGESASGGYWLISSSSESYSCTERAEYVTAGGARNCLQRRYTASSLNSSQEYQSLIGRNPVSKTTQVSVASSGPGAPCAGSTTDAYTDFQNPENNYSETSDAPVVTCACPNPHYVPGLSPGIANEFNFSDGVFTLSSTPSPGTTVNAVITFSDPVSVEMLKAEIAVREGMAGMWQSVSAGASSQVIFTYGYPDPPEGGEAPENPEPVCEQVTGAMIVRKRFRVPGSFTRSYYEVRAQIWFFPKKWEEWDVLRDAYDLAVKEREEWVAGGNVGPEPEIPEEPGEEPTPKPTKQQDVEWTKSGSDTSPWFMIDFPDDAVEGESRIVNMGVKCLKSRWGTKLRFIGELYNPDGTEEV